MEAKTSEPFHAEHNVNMVRPLMLREPIKGRQVENNTVRLVQAVLVGVVLASDGAWSRHFLSTKSYTISKIYFYENAQRKINAPRCVGPKSRPHRPPTTRWGSVLPEEILPHQQALKQYHEVHPFWQAEARRWVFLCRREVYWVWTGGFSEAFDRLEAEEPNAALWEPGRPLYHQICHLYLEKSTNRN